MTRTGIKNDTTPAPELPITYGPEPAFVAACAGPRPGLAERHLQAQMEMEVRNRVTFAAYDIPFGDSRALAHAQISKRPHDLPVRMRHGALEHFSLEVAINAILHGGGKLELS